MRAHSRTEEDNKQVAAKNKMKCLKTHTKHDVATEGGGGSGVGKIKKSKVKETVRGQEKGKLAQCAQVGREGVRKNMVTWRSY